MQHADLPDVGRVSHFEIDGQLPSPDEKAALAGEPIPPSNSNRYLTENHAAGGFGGFANPTASVGLVAVNGVATTAMRSDGAPALDQGIVPTWTGLHTFGAGVKIDQPAVAGAMPTLVLDQGDVSEQCIEFRSDGVDRDIHLETVDVTGTPARDWDESEDQFRWNKGHIVEISDAVTNAVDDCLELEHVTSGAAAALFGIGQKLALEAADGGKVDTATITSLWADPQAAYEDPLLRFSGKISDVGYCGFWSDGGNAVDDAGWRVIVPDGVGDVKHLLRFMYVVQEVTGGGVNAGQDSVAPGTNVLIYNDGTDAVRVRATAAGQVEVVRISGADTFLVSMFMVWR